MWARRIGAALAVTGIAAALPSMFSGMQNRPAVVSAEPQNLRELREAIRRMEGALLPAQRKAIAAQIGRRLPEFEPLLLAILAQPQNQLFPGAATIAAELAVEGSLEILLDVLPQTKEKARAAAVLAVDTLEPLPDSEVEDLLLDIDTRIVLAGLEIAARRAPMPLSLVGPILSTLRLGDRQVRAHAVPCLPEELGDEHAEAVLSLLDEFPADAGLASLLARIAPTQRTTDALLARLAEADAEAISRLAPALQRHAASPEIRGQLWSIAQGSDEVDRRARAIYCLELTETRDGFPTSTLDWPPVLQYHMARLRVAGGELAGLDSLLELAGTTPGNDPELDQAAGLARLLVGRLAKLPPHASIEELQTWRAGLTSIPAQKLPPPQG